jgi:hypothetical protein
MFLKHSLSPSQRYAKNRASNIQHPPSTIHHPASSIEELGTIQPLCRKPISGTILGFHLGVPFCRRRVSARAQETNPLPTRSQAVRSPLLNLAPASRLR